MSLSRFLSEFRENGRELREKFPLEHFKCVNSDSFPDKNVLQPGILYQPAACFGFSRVHHKNEACY